MDNIDKQIAEKVMGWEALEPPGFWWDETNHKFEKPVCKDGENPLNAWRPSTNIAHAFEVVGKMAGNKKGYYFRLEWFSGNLVREWTAEFNSVSRELYNLASADTPAMAICLAALKAKEA